MSVFSNSGRVYANAFSLPRLPRCRPKYFAGCSLPLPLPLLACDPLLFCANPALKRHCHLPWMVADLALRIGRPIRTDQRQLMGPMELTAEESGLPMLVVGATGSGKTRMIIKYLIEELRSADMTSVVVVDQIGRENVGSPVTQCARMPSSA